MDENLKNEVKWNFPNCIGAIDDTAITIKVVPDTGSYYNYKEFNKILMVIVDANYKFIYRVNGKVSDGEVFDACTFSRLLLNESNLQSITD